MDQVAHRAVVNVVDHQGAAAVLVDCGDGESACRHGHPCAKVGQRGRGLRQQRRHEGPGALAGDPLVDECRTVAPVGVHGPGDERGGCWVGLGHVERQHVAKVRVRLCAVGRGDGVSHLRAASGGAGEGVDSLQRLAARGPEPARLLQGVAKGAPAVRARHRGDARVGRRGRRAKVVDFDSRAEAVAHDEVRARCAAVGEHSQGGAEAAAGVGGANARQQGGRSEAGDAVNIHNSDSIKLWRAHGGKVSDRGEALAKQAWRLRRVGQRRLERARHAGTSANSHLAHKVAIRVCAHQHRVGVHHDDPAVVAPRLRALHHVGRDVVDGVSEKRASRGVCSGRHLAASSRWRCGRRAVLRDSHRRDEQHRVRLVVEAEAGADEQKQQQQGGEKRAPHLEDASWVRPSSPKHGLQARSLLCSLLLCRTRHASSRLPCF